MSAAAPLTPPDDEHLSVLRDQQLRAASTVPTAAFAMETLLGVATAGDSSAAEAHMAAAAVLALHHLAVADPGTAEHAARAMLDQLGVEP